MKEKIILVGGGGHCFSCIDVLENLNKYEIIGIIDKKENIGKKILNYKIIGCDEDIPDLSSKYKNFLITIGQVKNFFIREKLFNFIKKNGGNLPIIVSKTAYVSKYVKIDEGTIIMHGVFINAGVSIGKNCIINTNSMIEHNSILGNFNHISTNSIINGDCIIGSNCFIGSNSVIKNNIKITDKIIIGAGSVIIKNIAEQGIYCGNPGEKIGK